MARRLATHLTLGLMLAMSLGWGGCAEKETVYQPAIAKLLESANALKKGGQAPEALCRLKAAADIDPTSYPVQYNLGIVYSDLNDWPAAETHLRKALEISPDQPNALYTLAYALEQEGMAYVTALNSSPEERQSSETPAVARGLSDAELADKARTTLEDAIQQYEAFLKVAPGNDPAKAEAPSIIENLKQTLSKLP